MAGAGPAVGMVLLASAKDAGMFSSMSAAVAPDRRGPGHAMEPTRNWASSTNPTAMVAIPLAITGRTPTRPARAGATTETGIATAAMGSRATVLMRAL